MGDDGEFSSDDGDFDRGRLPPHDDNEFDEGEDSFDVFPGGGANPDGGDANVVQNRPYDETMELSDDGSDVNSPTRTDGDVLGGSRPAGAGLASGTISNQHHDEEVELSDEGSVDDEEDDGSPDMDDDDQFDADTAQTQEPRAHVLATVPAMAAPSAMASNVSKNFPTLEAMTEVPQPHVHDDDDSDAGSPDMGESSGVPEGMYDPAEYAHLGVSTEIEELFEYIGRRPMPSPPTRGRTPALHAPARHAEPRAIAGTSLTRSSSRRRCARSSPTTSPPSARSTRSSKCRAPTTSPTSSASRCLTSRPRSSPTRPFSRCSYAR